MIMVMGKVILVRREMMRDLSVCFVIVILCWLVLEDVCFIFWEVMGGKEGREEKERKED